MCQPTYCSNHFAIHTYIKPSCYALQTYTMLLCQLYLNKAGEEKETVIYLCALVKYIPLHNDIAYVI